MAESLAPDTTLEREYWSRGVRLVAGVDEVGRGCLAGPVVAAACILPPGIEQIDGVRDSKLLTPKKRSELVEVIHSTALATAIGAASRGEIDRLNIRAATALAMRRALARLGAWQQAIIDGPLFVEFSDDPCTGVIDADATCLSVACASILAKEARDALMGRLAGRHPEYGWEENAGYGTARHLDALQRFG
ncbi:MAG TPA: ribonuclease HII, partial [Nitrolancea sp.]|nr:ribonuclease HII [Nitrolancea sp.]